MKSCIYGIRAWWNIWRGKTSGSMMIQELASIRTSSFSNDTPKENVTKTASTTKNVSSQPSSHLSTAS